MKRLLVIGVLLVALSGYSQKNVVKVGLLGLSYGDLSLGYERAIGEKISLNASFGNWNLARGAANPMDYLTEGNGIWLSELGSGIHASLEFRYYMGQSDVLNGFYMAPYLRYWTQSFTLSDQIGTAVNGVEVLTDFDIESDVSGFGLGIQIGYQWIINEKISLDWYFVGLGADRLALDAAYIAYSDLDFSYSQIVDDVINTLDDYGALVEGFEVSAESDHLQINLNRWIPGIRTGFTIGFAF